jgi:hypothetical protein
MINSACLDVAAERILTASCEKLPTLKRSVELQRAGIKDVAPRTRLRSVRPVLVERSYGTRSRERESGLRGAAAHGPMVRRNLEDDLITWAASATVRS